MNFIMTTNYIFIFERKNLIITYISCVLLRFALVELSSVLCSSDRLCGLVVRVLGYRPGGPGLIPGTTRNKSSGSGTASTQPREYN
jgi:hypothetical protein